MKKILIVDDSALTRKAIKRIVEMIDGYEDCQIFEAGNGLEALMQLSQESVDFVMADLNMPRMNGVELIEQINKREATAGVPVIVVSTESNEEKLKTLFDQGVKHYLHKPFTPEQIKETVESLEEVCS